MTIYFECNYCGHKWKETHYYDPSPGSIVCTKCKDSNVKVKASSPTVDFYPKDSKK